MFMLAYILRVERHFLRFVGLAQLDRAFGYGPKGRGFESSSARWFLRSGMLDFQAFPSFFMLGIEPLFFVPFCTIYKIKDYYTIIPCILRLCWTL